MLKALLKSTNQLSDDGIKQLTHLENYLSILTTMISLPKNDRFIVNIIFNKVSVWSKRLNQILKLKWFLLTITSQNHSVPWVNVMVNIFVFNKKVNFEKITKNGKQWLYLDNVLVSTINPNHFYIWVYVYSINNISIDLSDLHLDSYKRLNLYFNDLYI